MTDRTPNVAPVFPGRPTPQDLVEKIAAVRYRYPGGASLTRELAQHAVGDALDLARDLERVMGLLAEAQVSLRAFVEPLELCGAPGPEFAPGGRLYCGLTNRHHAVGRLHAGMARYGSGITRWVSGMATPSPAESHTSPPAGDRLITDAEMYSWGPLPHPPWPTT